MDGFKDALDVCGLIDLGFKGRTWTFGKKVAGGTVSDLIVLLRNHLGARYFHLLKC